VEFFFDFASPYGYLAGTQIDALAGRFGRRVTWRPFVLAAAFKATGMRPVMEQPLRGDYLLHDVPRFARLLGVPFVQPPVMPMHSIAASRAFYWLEEDRPELAHFLALSIWQSHFGAGQDLGPPAAVAALAGRMGIDPDALLAGIEQASVKQRLRDETDRAIARGIFGSPTMVVDGEAFWGADRLGQVERWLGGRW
jgi:2-hydroxychromene-2-carboxylate isomerase